MACSEFLCDLVFVSENKILGLVCMHFLYADNQSVSLIVILNFYEFGFMIAQGSKFIFVFGCTCATRSKFLGAQL